MQFLENKTHIKVDTVARGQSHIYNLFEFEDNMMQLDNI